MPLFSLTCIVLASLLLPDRCACWLLVTGDWCVCLQHGCDAVFNVCRAHGEASNGRLQGPVGQRHACGRLGRRGANLRSGPSPHQPEPRRPHVGTYTIHTIHYKLCITMSLVLRSLSSSLRKSNIDVYSHVFIIVSPMYTGTKCRIFRYSELYYILI